jgi:hypothetical protein
MEKAKEALPTSLYVGSHNPLTALYDACGDGIHELSDEQCLERSRKIRIVLGRLTERIASMIAEDKEYREAVGSLAGRTGEQEST